MFVRNKREINVEEEPHRFRSANFRYAESLSLPIHRERKRERERGEEGEIGREKEKAYGVKFRVREVTLPRKHLTARLLIIRHVVAKRATMTLFTP